MCSANRFFFEWVTHLASNYQIRPHKSEPIILDGQGWLCTQLLPGSLLILLKISSLLALMDISVLILDVPHLENA